MKINSETTGLCEGCKGDKQIKTDRQMHIMTCDRKDKCIFKTPAG